MKERSSLRHSPKPSLYSEELGDVPIVQPAAVPLEGDLIAGSQAASSQNAPSASESDKDFQSPPKIALNPRAAKSGRPRINTAHHKKDERESRLRFNAAQEAWKATGTVTLNGLADALDEEKPDIADTASRLSALQVRYTDNSGKGAASKKKPKYAVEKDPVLNQTAFYLLPASLLDRCFEVLPVANEKDEAIEVFMQSQSESTTAEGRIWAQRGAKGQRMGTECVTIAGYGKYSRVQIESMRRLSKLKDDCNEGKLLCE
jgi:hypothetical protein